MWIYRGRLSCAEKRDRATTDSPLPAEKQTESNDPKHIILSLNNVTVMAAEKLKTYILLLYAR